MRKLLLLLLPVVLAGLYFLQGPYLWPVSLGLGPCLKDYTSPSTYEQRASPLRETRFRAGGADLAVCYGAPSARGRALFAGDSGLVKPGRPWRMGANEPTRLFTSGPVQLGQLQLPAGRYSIYAITDSLAWEVFVSTSTWHWGNQISENVRSKELGSIRTPVQTAATYADTLAFRGTENGLWMQWGSTSIFIPITAGDS